MKQYILGVYCLLLYGMQYVHDRYVFAGGAEAVLSQLMRRFGVDETTHLYVLYSPHHFFLFDGKKIPIVTALPVWCNKLLAWGASSSCSFVRVLFDYRNLLVIYPLLCWCLRRKILQANTSHCVISSFATAKNVVPFRGWKIHTTLYLHSPMQYIWENYDEYTKKLHGMTRVVFSFACTYLRPRDKKHRYYQTIYVNSVYTQSCAYLYYGMQDTQVWYPKVHCLFCRTQVVSSPRAYFVYIGRLVRFIREVDRIIQVCSLANVPLLVLGTGPDENYLKSLAGPSVIFVGHISDHNEKIKILSHARGLINLAKESCGIATMEALLLGVPVLGYAQGGTYELIAEAKSTEISNILLSLYGILVQDKSVQTLRIALEKHLAVHWDRGKIQAYARSRFACED